MNEPININKQWGEYTNPTADTTVHCVAPFSSMVIQHSFAAPCCEWYTHEQPFDRNKTIKELHDDLAPLRERFIEAKNDINAIPECAKCASGSLQFQDHNRDAREDIDYINNPTLTYLHLKFNNLCNLACRMCGASCSSQFAREIDKRFDETKRNPYLDNILPEGSDIYQSVYEVLPGITKLWFSGGEPLIQKQVWEIINYCCENGLSPNIELKFNTNGTVILTDQQKQWLSEFKHVYIDISVDAVGELGEYIRTRMVWEDFEENVKDYLRLAEVAPITIFTATAYGVHNALALPELFDWCESMGLPRPYMNPIWYPPSLAIPNQAPSTKEYIRKYYDDLVESRTDLEKDSFYEAYRAIEIPTITSSKYFDPAKLFIDAQDDHAIAGKFHANYRRFSEVAPEWYNNLALPQWYINKQNGIFEDD